MKTEITSSKVNAEITDRGEFLIIWRDRFSVIKGFLTKRENDPGEHRFTFNSPDIGLKINVTFSDKLHPNLFID